MHRPALCTELILNNTLCLVLKLWSPAVFCLRGSDYFKSPRGADLVSRLGTSLVFFFVLFPSAHVRGGRFNWDT